MRSFFKCICEDEFPGNTVKPIRTAEYDIKDVTLFAFLGNDFVNPILLSSLIQ